MPPLISYSPLKTGSIFTGFDASNFVVRSKPSTLSISRAIFYPEGGVFVLIANASIDFYHLGDPTAGITTANRVGSAGSNCTSMMTHIENTGTFIVVQYSPGAQNSDLSTNIRYSGDWGATWVNRSLGLNANWNKGGIANGYAPDGTHAIIMTTQNSALTSGIYVRKSYDGGWTWVNGSSNTGIQGSSRVIHNPVTGQFVMLNTSAGKSRYSLDAGNTWLPGPTYPGAVSSWKVLNGKFIVWNNSSTIYISDDAINWTAVGLPIVPFTNEDALVYANGLYIFCATGFSYMFSADLINWGAGAFPGGFAGHCVAYGHGHLVFTSTVTGTSYSATRYLTYAF